MRKLRILIGIIVIAGAGLLAGDLLAQGDNGIPGDCPHTAGVYYRAGAFPRYEAHNQRIVLVSWTTGADLMELDTSLAVDGFQIINWSPDCRYLAVGLGSASSIDTVIYDTLTARRVGVFLDAHGRPHTLTWSPNSAYLTVETRDGAYLWELLTNRRHLLTAFHDLNGRSFQQVRWNLPHGQVITLGLDGTRQAYALADGLPVQEVVSAPPTGSAPVAFNRHAYTCAATSYFDQAYGWSYGWEAWEYQRPYHANARAQLQNVELRYEPTATRVVLTTPTGDVLHTIEAGLVTEGFRPLGWSADCRYVAAAVGPRTDMTTIVWDLDAGQRIGTVANAQLQPHRLTWLPTSEHVVVETRHGAYLWHFPTDTRTLLNPHADADGHNFYSMDWDPMNEQLLTVPVGYGNAVIAYDGYTGAQTGYYPTQGPSAPVGYEVSADGSRIVVFTLESQQANRNAASSIAVYDRGTGGGVHLHPGDYAAYSSRDIALSPDNRYLIADDYSLRRRVRVWDLSALPPGSTTYPPTYIHEVVSGWNLTFVDGKTFKGSSNRLFDAVTGEPVYRATLAVPGNTPATPPVSRPTAGSGWASTGRYDGCAFDPVPFTPLAAGDTNSLIAADGSRHLHRGWSPNCRYLVTQWQYTITVWDSTTGHAVFDLHQPREIYWNPAGDRALFDRWYWAGTGEPVQVDYFGAPLLWRRDHQVYWDTGRGQVLVNGAGGVVALDDATGSTRYVFTRPNEGPTFFALSADRQWMVSFSDHGPGTQVGGIAVWNLATLAGRALDNDDFAAYEQGQIAISPNGQYVVAGYTALRVWDMHGTDAAPVHRHAGPDDTIQQVRFVDATTVETTDYFGNVTYWDILTGAAVPVDSLAE
jgi:WD40 repeat protein